MSKKALSIGCLWLLALVAGVLQGCSTTKVLSPDEARLVENKIVITNDPSYNSSGLAPYIKQKSNHYVFGKWHPGLYIYNWQNGKGKGWDRFCQKIGQEPVVFDESLIEDSVESILDHLRYQGYYYSTVEPRIRDTNQLARVEYDVTLGNSFPSASRSSVID